MTEVSDAFYKSLADFLRAVAGKPLVRQRIARTKMEEERERLNSRSFEEKRQHFEKLLEPDESAREFFTRVERENALCSTGIDILDNAVRLRNHQVRL